MTLKEAIAEINKKANEYMSAYSAPRSPSEGNPYFEGKAHGLCVALEILVGVDKDDIAAQVKQWQGEALVRMTRPAATHDERAYHDGMATAYGNALKLIVGEDAE